MGKQMSVESERQELERLREAARSRQPVNMTEREELTLLREKAAQVQSQAEPEGFGAKLQREIEGIPRQIGLTGRHLIEGASEMAGIVADPVALGLNQMGGHYPTMSSVGTAFADKLGLPEPENAAERIVGRASKMMGGVGGVAKTASKLGSGAIAKGLATQPGMQIAGAGAGGAAGQYTEETGGGVGAQFGASLAASFGTAGLMHLAQRLGTQITSAVNSFRGSNIPREEISMKLASILKENGIKVSEISDDVGAVLAKEIQKSIDTGTPIDKQVLLRIADYSKVGATPTRGTTTLNPAQITQEKNLAKVGANSSNPELQRLSNIQRQNDMVLTENLNKMGANTADDVVDTGRSIIQSLKAYDAPKKAVVDAAYKAVRNSKGRYAEMDTKSFSTMANNALDEQQ